VVKQLYFPDTALLITRFMEEDARPASAVELALSS